MTAFRPCFAAIAGAAILIACSSSGIVNVSARGRAPGPQVFEDRVNPLLANEERWWSVRYEKILVSVRRVELAREGTLRAGAYHVSVVDLMTDAPMPLAGFPGLEDGAWDLGYEIGPPLSDSKVSVFGAEAADIQTLRANGFGLYVRGVAENGAGGRKTFEWGFGLGVRYERCGLAEIAGGETKRVELGFDPDRLFMTSLMAERYLARGFAAIAWADDEGDRDGIVTLDELSKMKLPDLAARGITYDVAAEIGIGDLKALVTKQAWGIGRFQGDTACSVAELPVP